MRSLCLALIVILLFLGGGNIAHAQESGEKTAWDNTIDSISNLRDDAEIHSETRVAQTQQLLHQTPSGPRYRMLEAIGEKWKKVTKNLKIAEIGLLVLKEVDDVYLAFDEEGWTGFFREATKSLVAIGAEIGVGTLIGGACLAVAGTLTGGIGVPIAAGVCMKVADLAVASLTGRMGYDGVGGGAKAIVQWIYDRGKRRRGKREETGPTIIHVTVDGEIVTSARGSAASATSNIGRVKSGSAEIHVNVDGSVITTARQQGTATTDIGVSTGRGNVIFVDVDGNVITTATGKAHATNQVGVADGDRNVIHVTVDGDIISSATGRSTSKNAIGIATGNQNRVEVTIDGNVITTSSGKSTSQSVIGQSTGNGGKARVNIDGDVTTGSSGVGKATTKIGVTNGGSVSATVNGDVTTRANNNNATTTIGTGRSGHTHIDGDVYTNAGQKGASTAIGHNSGVSAGNIYNDGGKLNIGVNGTTSRDGRICLQIYHKRCVTQIIPRQKHGCPVARPPARWYDIGAVCYYVPDHSHKISR